MNEWSKDYKPTVLQLCIGSDLAQRKKCRRLAKNEILSDAVQNLVDDIKYTCDHNNYGVGLSANQVGEFVAISVIAIKPTPGRPNLESFDQVCINLEIAETFGERILMWEGCLSTASDYNGEPSMAQVLRYPKVRIKYLDRLGHEHDEIVDGFLAHVAQHEADHVNGVLFTDLVDSSDLISNSQYREMMASD